METQRKDVKNLLYNRKRVTDWLTDWLTEKPSKTRRTHGKEFKFESHAPTFETDFRQKLSSVCTGLKPHAHVRPQWASGRVTECRTWPDVDREIAGSKCRISAAALATEESKIQLKGHSSERKPPTRQCSSPKPCNHYFWSCTQNSYNNSECLATPKSS